MKLSTSLLFSILIALGACGAAHAQTPAPGPFAKDQIATGRDQFQTNCAACHGANLSGDSGPALAGKAFLDRWKGQSTADLYTFIRKTMPMCEGGSLGNAAYADLVAYLMWANGAEAGKDEFDGSAAVSIGSIVTGTTRPELSASSK